jgi:hypothetical protein
MDVDYLTSGWKAEVEARLRTSASITAWTSPAP